MKQIGVIIIFFLMALSLPAQKVQLERVDQWKFDHEPFVWVGQAFISKNNSIIGIMGNVVAAEIKKDGINQFIELGEGPNQVIIPTLIFPYGDDIAIVELVGRVKIFTQKENSYTFKKSIWLKKGPLPLSQRGCIYKYNKFFISGANYLSQDNETTRTALVSIFDEKGKLIKTLLEKKWSTNLSIYNILFHIENFKNDQLIFIPENEPTVTLISPKSMEVVKQVPLTVPSFYKKMPTDFWTNKLLYKPGDNAHFDKMRELFLTGYSMIYNLYYDQNRLIIQMRTCDKKLKRYAILLYNADTFKLEHTLYTDDYLVGVKDGKFYCFANGNPGWDGDIDDVVFNIYRLKK